MTDYRVLRAFREPREGGPTVPYRFYEVGVTVTIDDFRAWQIGSAIEGEKHRLIQDGFLQEITPPVVHPVAEHTPEPVEHEKVAG